MEALWKRQTSAERSGLCAVNRSPSGVPLGPVSPKPTRLAGRPLPDMHMELRSLVTSRV
jgi:hypothetical protein